MTTYFITTNTINTSSDGIDLNTGDVLVIESGVTMAGGTGGTDSEGAESSGSGISAEILGTLWGNSRGINFYGSDGGDTVFVGTGGSVIGDTGEGIVLGGDNDVVTNNGEIVGSILLSDTTNAGISLNGGNGTITNNGTITADFGIFLEDGGTVINNSGAIDGTNDGILADTPGTGLTDTIDNSGTIRSGSGGAAITASNPGTGSFDVTNSGHLVGAVDFAGGNDFYDGSLGSVTGLVYGAGGNDILIGGAGTDNLDGGTGNDTLNGMGGNDYLTVEGAQATVDGGDGNDTIYMESNFNASDKIDGGDGKDTMILDGNYSAGVVLGADTLTNVEKIVLDAGFSYNLTTDDNNVAAGARLVVDGSALTTSSLTFNGSAETDGRFTITGGASGDTLTGGAGNDIINGGAGKNIIDGGGGADNLTGGGNADTFVYTDVSDSTSTAHDIINGFNTTNDLFNLDVTVTGISAEVTSGRLTEANFDTNLTNAISAAHLAAGHAVLFTPTLGGFAGHTFLIVDANGVAGYQAGQDYVFELVGAAHLTSLATTNFI